LFRPATAGAPTQTSLVTCVTSPARAVTTTPVGSQAARFARLTWSVGLPRYYWRVGSLTGDFWAYMMFTARYGPRAPNRRPRSKNSLFSSHDEAAQNLAAIHSIVTTCRLHDRNRYEYIKDVLVRIQSHPAGHVDELLTWNWQPSALPEHRAVQ
jgi:hypothetical protein